MTWQPKAGPEPPDPVFVRVCIDFVCGALAVWFAYMITAGIWAIVQVLL